MQYNLLPQRIKRLQPLPKPTGDANGIGTAVSGQKYLVKSTMPWHKQLPASEWICHGLARCLDLAVPTWEHCILPDGRPAFGSRLEGALEGTLYYPNERAATDNPEVVSGAFVLDLFVANGDRHSGQWLVTRSGDARLLRPIDFSRAWFWKWPLPTPPFGPGSPLARGEDNSHRFYSIARQNSVVQSAEAVTTLEALRSMPKSAWHAIISTLPEDWITSQEAIELRNWWWSPQWHSRIEWIRTQL